MAWLRVSNAGSWVDRISAVDAVGDRALLSCHHCCRGPRESRVAEPVCVTPLHSECSISPHLRSQNNHRTSGRTPVTSQVALVHCYSKLSGQVSVTRMFYAVSTALLYLRLQWSVLFSSVISNSKF
jgi:hypothetical protein